MSESLPIPRRGSQALAWLDENFEKPFIIVCLLITLLLTPYQVFIRYFVAGYLKITVNTAYVEELVIFSYIWATYFSLPLTIKRRKSIRITAFTDYFVPKKYNGIILVMNNLTYLGLSVIIAVLSVRLIEGLYEFPQRSTALGISYMIPYSVLFFGFVLVIFRLVQDTIRLVREHGVSQFFAGLVLTAAIIAPFLVNIGFSSVFILTATLFGYMILGVPIAVTMGISGALTLISLEMPIDVVAQQAFTSLDSFPMLSIFYFIAAGIFMGGGGLSARLIDVADAMLGHRTGGIAMATIVACMLFGAISGSGPATVAAIGVITIPAMVERGYSVAFAAAVTACAGSIGVMIPPSNPFVLYGLITQTSIGKLFIGGIAPGILCGGILCFISWLIARKNGWHGNKVRKTGAQRLRTLWDAKWALMVPVIILGGIYGGIMTPTEAAAVAALYGLLVGIFVYKAITRHNIIELLLKSMVTTSLIMFLMAMAHVFGYAMALEQIPETIARWMVGITSSKVMMLLILNVFLLICGALMDSVAATVILTPILVPVAMEVGVDPVHFGIIMVCNLAIGFVTPPIGVNLFVANAISGESTEKIALQTVPMIIGMIVMLLIITYVEEVPMFLTRVL